MQKRRFRKYYEVSCCLCGKKFGAEPSIFMKELERNSARANCPKCHVLLHLMMFPDLSGNKMISEPFSWHIKKGAK